MSLNKSTSRESTPIQEYVIRVTPKTNKKYNVMRFSELDSIDFTKWKNVKLDREFNLKEFKASVEDEAPKFGAGSVFGADQREETRKKRYQKYASRHRPEDQPYILSVKQSKVSSQTNGSQTTSSKSSSSRKFRGIREGGITDNTSYYVFFQAHDGAFEAFPVSEWYKFAPIPKFKALTAEEAEEQFTKRDKILNFFTVMNKKKGQNSELNDNLEDGQFAGKSRRRKDFKTSDLDDWGDFGNFSDGSGNESDEGNSKSKKKGKKRESDDDDSEPKEESDEGDFDTREVDYMSDTSSDEGEDNEDIAKRLNEELKGVEDEDALRQLVISDEEDEDEEQKPEDDKLKKETDQQKNDKVADKKLNYNETIENVPKIKQEKKSNSSDESDSSDEDFDDNKFQSSIFMQKNEIKKESTNDQQQNTKRKLDTSDSRSQPNASGNSIKRPRVNGPETNLEETVKRYLMRKPITTTELIKNVKKMKVTDSKEGLVALISKILKKLNPTKQTISDKLYLYLNPKEAKRTE